MKPTMDVRVVNISEHGLMIETPFGLPPASSCELTLLLGHGEVLIRARVARCRANMVKRPDGQPVVRFHAGLEFSKDFAESDQLKSLMEAVCTGEGTADISGSVTLHEGLEHAM